MKYTHVSVIFTILLTGLLLVFAGLFSTPVYATSHEGGIVTCTGVYEKDNPNAIPCGTCEFVSTLNNAIDFLIILASIIATIALVVVGLKLVVSAGSDAAKTAAKQTLWYIVLGLFFIIAAYAIIGVIITILIPANSAEHQQILNWRNFNVCINQTVPNYNFNPDLEGSTTSLDCDRTAADAFDCTKQEDACKSGGGIPEKDISDPMQYKITCRYPNATGGSCESPTDPANACSESNMTCFGDAAAASSICSLESAGGNTGVMSGSDLCADGLSFSGGLWQINILANNSKVPGCSGNFYTTAPSAPNACDRDGDSAQGGCLDCKTNTRGVQYCAKWNCQITNTVEYAKCVNQVKDPAVNTAAACELYANGGWNPWRTSAKACNVI